jgi:hypothetical protein
MAIRDIYTKRDLGDTLKELPWYLSSSDESKDDSNPDYIISSGLDAIPACLHLSKANKKSFSGKTQIYSEN